MRRSLIIALAALAAVCLAAPAAASVKAAKPDVSEYPRVAVNVTTYPRTLFAPRLTENGQRVAAFRARNLGDRKSIVVAIDRSASMNSAGVADAIAAARSFVRRKGDGDRVAVVAFGSRAVQLAEFSGATIDADVALRTLSVDAVKGTALNDAVVLSARALAGEAPGARVLVLLTDGRDVSSTASQRQAIASAQRNGVAVYAIGIESEQFSPAPLREIASATGGSYRGVSSTGALGSVYASLAAELQRTWRLEYVTAARPGDRVRLQVSAGSAGATSAWATLPGDRQTSAPAQPSAAIPDPLYGMIGVLAVGLAVWTLVLLALRLTFSSGRQARIRRRLAPHVERAVDGKRSGARLRAMGGVLTATEKTFSKSRYWDRIERFLERGDVPLRTVEFLYLTMGMSVVVGLLIAVAARSSLFILAGFVVGGAIPWAWVKLRGRRRLKAFESQLPDLLLTLAASLKAGHSFKQGMQTIVDEGAAPASLEFKRVLTEMRLGRPMDESLAEMSQRVGSKNLDFVITAVRIQSQVGGSLAGLIDMVAEAVRQRQQFAAKIRGLTSMGRASAYTLLGLPFVIAAAITIMNRDYMSPLYHTGAGHTLIVIGAVMITIGALILRKMVSFKG